MKTLETIQKTFHIFGIFLKIAFVFCVVGAILCGVGAACVMAEQTQWLALKLFGQQLVLVPVGVSVNQIVAELFAGVVLLTTEATLLRFACHYIKVEQAEGTPFTENGADLLKKLGIRCIYMPIVAMVLVGVVTACFGALEVDGADSLPSLSVGLVLILASVIFRYGAQLEAQVREK